jgi:glucose-1-phosphate cytidylyltransferase
MTGGRIKRVLPYVQDEEAFCLTYGDGVGDVDIARSIQFHRQHGKLATLTAVQPAGRWGSLVMKETAIVDFQEKPAGDGQWINGGFFVLSPKVGEYIAGEATPFEQDSLPRLAHAGELRAFHHRGFWQPMDTLRDKNHLEELWASGKAAWKTWA